ncbi:hypothetical protein HYU13_03320 [Candidatus Woesearchaeota archaeon]|nr:hypothetical protein [Candidatus Woesearchaeota archaeon]
MPITTFSLWKRFHRFLKPYLGTFVCAILFGTLATGLSLLPPALSRVMFDVAFTTKNSSLFVTLMLALCVLALLRFALGAVNDLLELYLSEEVSLKITQNLFAKLAHLPLSFVQLVLKDHESSPLSTKFWPQPEDCTPKESFKLFAL